MQCKIPQCAAEVNIARQRKIVHYYPQAVVWVGFRRASKDYAGLKFGAAGCKLYANGGKWLNNEIMKFLQISQREYKLDCAFIHWDTFQQARF